MSSSLSRKKLSQQLQAVASRPAEAATLIRNLAERNRLDARYLLELEAAIALVRDDQQRHTLAGVLNRLMDVHRAWLPDAAIPDDQTTTVYCACVPFTVADLTLLKSPDVLQLLTGPLDSQFSRGQQDALFPGHRQLVLAVPLVGLKLDDRWALNFMLANSHADTPVDRMYAELWVEFGQQKHEPDQAVFGYLFSLAVKGPPTRSLPLTQRATLPLTDWAQYATDTVMRHAAELNAKHPELGMQVHAMTTLSDAVEMASELRFKSMFSRYAKNVGRMPFRLNESAAHLSGVSREAIARYNTEREQLLLEAPPAREELYGQAVIGLLTSVVQDRAAEFLQLGLFTKAGALSLFAGVQVPLGTLPQDCRRWWGHLDPEKLAQVVELPTEYVSDFNSILLGMMRDASGRWVERELLHWGPQASELYLTAKWTTAFGFEEAPLPEDPEARAPLTEMFEKLPLSKALTAHFRPVLLEPLKRLLATPGMCREVAYMTLEQQCPALEHYYLQDPFNAFVPSTMWAVLHHQMAAGVLFRVHESVQEQMALTDVEHRFPLAFLRSPYPDVYLHFEHRMPIEVQGMPRGWFDGAFVSDRVLSEQEALEREVPAGTRLVAITVTLNDESDPMSLNNPSNSILIYPDDDRDLAEILRTSVERAAQEKQGIEREAYLQATRLGVVQPLMEVCKILLYINLPEARLTKELKRTDMLAQARAATGRDRQRLMGRAHSLRDAILVGPIPPMALEDDGPGDGTRGVRPHPRRGHVRSQPYGEGLKLRRPKWIPPVLVNKKLLSSDSAPPAKDYSVR